MPSGRGYQNKQKRAMLRYPQSIQRCGPQPHNPLQPTQLVMNGCEVEKITKRSTYGIPRQSHMGVLYATSLKHPPILEFDDEVELRIKWTTYRSETVDALLNLNGAPQFSEHYNIVEEEKQYVEAGILTTVQTREIQNDKQRSKFKSKLNRIFKRCRQKFKHGFHTKSVSRSMRDSHSMSPPLLQEVDPLLIVSPSPTDFCVSTFDENSGWELLSPGYTSPLSDS